jgi:hypothetical protein
LLIAICISQTIWSSGGLISHFLQVLYAIVVLYEIS